MTCSSVTTPRSRPSASTAMSEPRRRSGSEPLRRLGSLMAVDAEGRLRGVITVDQVTRALRSRLAPG